jgi:hypothetical protein
MEFNNLKVLFSLASHPIIRTRRAHLNSERGVQEQHALMRPVAKVAVSGLAALHICAQLLVDVL